MFYEPKHNDFVDMFLSEHSEKRIRLRFPSLRLKPSFDVYVSYCESKKAEPMWAIAIQGGFIIGKWERAKLGSRIQGIFIAQTALMRWQFKRSEFVRTKSVQVHFRRVNSQIQNKMKAGKICDSEPLMVTA